MIQGSAKEGTTLENTIKFIKANNGRFTIIGTNPAYHPQLPNKLRSSTNFSNNSIEKIIVAAPYFSSKSGKNWYYKMSYDATQVLIDAISKAKKSNITGEDVQKEIKGDLKVQSATHTGAIEFNGCDRKNAPYDLIQPHCTNGSCEWKKIPDNQTSQKSTP